MSKALRSTVAKMVASVWRANVQLKETGLAPMTWGNVSQIDRATGIIAIKPSGIAYEKLKVSDIVLADINGKVTASRLHPSSDLPSHLEIYRAFPSVGAVVHTHSTFATAFAQARTPVPCLGTTHADYCAGDVPVTDEMPPAKIKAEYEKHTGEMIVNKLRRMKLDPLRFPFILVARHGPFAWGRTASHALENALVLEQICKMAFLTFLLAGKLKAIPGALITKHFFRKHGPNAYYGQEKK